MNDKFRLDTVIRLETISENLMKICCAQDDAEIRLDYTIKELQQLVRYLQEKERE